MHSPDTRPSLILRLKNLRDVQAWTEFTAVYEPLVYRLATKLGMQHADADEAKQEVMLHLAKVVATWQPTEQGSFRGWLYRVARNVMLRYLEKNDRHVAGSGDSRHQDALAQIKDRSEAEFDLEFQRQVFAWATRRIRAEVQPATWSAFWDTFVEQQPVEGVAEQLGMSVGNVYVARCRVMKRLREAVKRQMDRDEKDLQAVGGTGEGY